MTAPGQARSAVQALRPGRYYVTGSGGERAAVAPLTVTGEAGAASLPATTADVTAEDYRFRTGGLRPGRQQLRFANAGAEPHHVLFARLLGGATADDARRFFEGRAFRSPPVDADRIEETAVLGGGQAQATEVDLREGRYALLCFVSDRAGGPPHTRKGMVAEVTVR